MMLMEMLTEAGLPPGVVNVIHGQHDAVNFILDSPDIKTVSFVGGDVAVSIFLAGFICSNLSSANQFLVVNGFIIVNLFYELFYFNECVCNEN